MKHYLLDTHTFLWWIMGNEQLSKTAKLIIASEKEIFLSAASTWEIAIKHSKGKLELPKHLSSFIHKEIQRNNITCLPITTLHTLEIALIPEYHQDPFDRILIAQAKLENMTLITNDALIQKYSIQTIW